MSKEKLNNLFKPFSRSDNLFNGQGKGTGLGLVLGCGLAGLHGGRAWLESEKGHGTQALVALPAEKNSEFAIAKQKSA